MTRLDINALEKRRDEKLVIRNLNLSVAEGEFVAIVGPSGCGKTTLLQILAGLQKASSGQCIFANPNPRVGVVFQNPRLLPWRTVRENLELVLADDERCDSAEEWLNRVELSDALDLYPERLSLGMMRRVALVRAFAIEPDLLLMDEPLVSLDAPTARKMRSLLMSLWMERPHTVLFVTHDLREAVELADRVVFVSSAPMEVVADIKVAIRRSDRTGEKIDAWVDALRSGSSEIAPWI